LNKILYNESTAPNMD